MPGVRYEDLVDLAKANWSGTLAVRFGSMVRKLPKCPRDGAS